MAERLDDHIYVMAADQPAYSTQVHHIEGPQHRVVAKDPSGSTAGFMEYAHKDGELHPRTTSTGLYVGKGHDRDTVTSHMMHAMHAAHPGVPLHDSSTSEPVAKPKPKIYYHGTTVPDVTHVLPASAHGQGVTFRSDTSADHAYATTSHKDAWNYAEKASEIHGGGRPRVYQVRPIGGHKNVEPDPAWDERTGRSRGNNESDHRSKHGFEVVREMKMPKDIHENGLWRDGADPADLDR